MSFECDVDRAIASFRHHLVHPTDPLESVTTRVVVPFVVADEEIGMVDVAGDAQVRSWMIETPFAVGAVRATGGGIASVTGTANETGIVIGNASWIFVTANVIAKGSGTENESVTVIVIVIAREIATLFLTAGIASGIAILWNVEQSGLNVVLTNRITDVSNATIEIDPLIIGNETALQVVQSPLDPRLHLRRQVLFLRITPRLVFLVSHLRLWTDPCPIVLPIVRQTGHQISNRQQNQPESHLLSRTLVGIRLLLLPPLPLLLLLLIDRSLYHPAPNHLKMLPLRRQSALLPHRLLHRYLHLVP